MPPRLYTFQAINPSTIPTHSTNLAGLDNFDALPFSLVFSDLEINGFYRLWIFSVYDVFQNSPAQFLATVSGGGASFSFFFDMNASGNLVINGVTSSSSQPLTTYGNVLSASSTGTIAISFTNTGGNGETPLAGVAIESLSAVPEARAWLIIGAVMFVAAAANAARLQSFLPPAKSGDANGCIGADRTPWPKSECGSTPQRHFLR